MIGNDLVKEQSNIHVLINFLNQNPDTPVSEFVGQSTGSVLTLSIPDKLPLCTINQFDERILNLLENSLSHEALQTFLKIPPARILQAAELEEVVAFNRFLKWDDSDLTYLHDEKGANLLHVALGTLPVAECRLLLEKLQKKGSLEQLAKERFSYEDRGLTPLFKFLKFLKLWDRPVEEVTQKLQLLQEFNMVNFATTDFDTSKAEGLPPELTVAEYHGLSNDQKEKLSKSAGANVIHYLAASNNVEALEFALNQCPELLNSRDRFDRTPLHLAVLQGAVSTVKYLLSLPNIDIDARSETNTDAFGFIIVSEEDNSKKVQLVKLIVEERKRRRTLQEECRNGKVVEAENDCPLQLRFRVRAMSLFNSPGCNLSSVKSQIKPDVGVPSVQKRYTGPKQKQE